ncbi:MAG: serine protease [Burkholderiales bacterium]|jgi:S1-C subfamily serine protease
MTLEVPGRRSIYFIVGSRSGDQKPRPGDAARGMAFAFERKGSACTLLTAAHVVKDSSEINASLWTDEQGFGTTFEARVAWIDEASDTAALTIRNTEDCNPVSRHDGPVPVGRRVFAFLHTPHARGMMTVGYIGGYWILNGSPAIVCDMQIQRGHSGSPLLDGLGRLIGMVVSKASTLDVNAGFAVPASRIESEHVARTSADTRTLGALEP